MHTLQRFIVAGLMCLLLTPVVLGQSAEEIEGDWIGTLEVGPNSLRLVFHIKSNEKGELTTTLDSPDQGANGIPTSETVFMDNKLDIDVAMIGGRYSGTLNEGRISGTWEQGGGSMRLDIERMTEPLSYNRPQEPQKPYPYKEDVVRFINEKEGFELEGTLTVPETGDTHPAVVLISGSGPQDRDEALMGHKPFLVLSDYLTRNGIAVLRFDDRGVGNSGGDFGSATTLDFVTDVEAAVEYLKGRQDIDANSIGLIGHSEGGLIAPIVTSQPDHAIAFAVMLAGPGLTGKDVLLTQSAKMVQMQGMSDEFIEKLSMINARLYDTVISSDLEAVKDELRLELAEIRGELSQMEVTMLGLVEERDDQIVSQLSSKWMKQFIGTDPAVYLGQMKTPVLSLIGDKDVQVLAQENTNAIEEALKRAGNEDYTAKIVPGLNHLFQKAETGLPAEYSSIEETFSEEVMEMIVGWIKERV